MSAIGFKQELWGYISIDSHLKGLGKQITFSSQGKTTKTFLSDFLLFNGANFSLFAKGTRLIETCFNDCAR